MRTAEVLAEADELFGAGRLVEAIDLLGAANLERRDPALETRMLHLRHEALPVVEHGREDWPPACPDIFAGVEGAPEVDAGGLSPEVLGAALVHHGCLLVRGLIPDRWIGQLVDDIDRAVDGFDAVMAGTPPAEVAPSYVPFECADTALSMGRAFTRQGGGVLAADSPPAMFDLTCALKDSPAPAAIAGYFGEWPALSVKKTTLRRTPPHAKPGWHQDGSFLDDTERLRTVNVWMALSSCGEDAPGLDIVPKQLGQVLRVDTGTPETDFSEGMKLLDRTADGCTVRPRFEAGDAMLFDHLTLHQTAVAPSMTRDRYAIEAWFFAPSVYPAGQLFMAF